MRLTLRTLSALLRYPDEAVQQAAPELTGWRKSKLRSTRLKCC